MKKYVEGFRKLVMGMSDRDIETITDYFIRNTERRDRSGKNMESEEVQ